ncbi:transporter substrate-binding domain-containing protein [Vibrio sp. T187]|uniref:substrate-binding periplasmic protein n=1 Tax=Vibrio TaxID=662 RepID=UPI0010C93AC7|nr:MULTISPECIES: transporter substrate-binding domain-containing protein [Vibrio]MBW3695231.1 transporter substrate-binding domain-containing protein [Vibrio sp. T187]
MKKQILSASIIGLLSAGSVSAAEPIHYYVIEKQAQPFQIEKNGVTHSGIVTDIVKAVFDDTKYELKYHTYPFNRMITQLEAREQENWITYGSPTWGNIQSANLSDIPIYNVKHTLMSSNKKPFEFEDMKDLDDKAVVLLMGFEYPNLDPYIEQGKLAELRVKDYTAAFRVLKRIPGDTVFVEMESRVKYNLAMQKLDPKSFQIQSFSSVIPDYPIHLAFDPKMDQQLQGFINQRLKDLKSSGKLEAIVDSYL